MSADVPTLNRAIAQSTIYVNRMLAVRHRTAFQNSRLHYWRLKRIEFKARRAAELLAAAPPKLDYWQPPTACGPTASCKGVTFDFVPVIPTTTQYIWHPAAKQVGAPVFVTIPGGPMAPNTSIVGTIPQLLAARGAIVLEATYRSLVQYGGGGAITFQDVGCAIRAARALAPALGGDPSRVTLIGHSYGGFVANELLLKDWGVGADCPYKAGSHRPDQWVSLNAISMACGEINGIPAGVGCYFLKQEYTDPITDMRAALFTATRKVPVLIVQGQNDTVAMLPLMSRSYFADLTAAGWHARYFETDDSHGSVLYEAYTANWIMNLK